MDGGCLQRDSMVMSDRRTQGVTFFVLMIAAAIAMTIALAPLPVVAQPTIPFSYEAIDANPPDATHCKDVGDFDGDGFIDAVVAGAESGEGLYWYRYPSWTKHVIVPPGVTGFTTDMQVGDVDNDGDLDLIIPKGRSVGGSVFWYENPRPTADPTVDTWVEHSIGIANAHDVEIGDLNGDGKLDVVVRQTTTTIFFQNSPTSWTKKTVNTRNREGTGLGDLDGDGDIDILINGYWLQNPGPAGDPVNGSWSERTISTAWPADVGAHVADVNGDGRMDAVLAPSESSNHVFAWYEAADPLNGPWTEHVIDATSEYIHTFKTADMDLDGDLDFVTAEMHQSSNPDEVSVYINNVGGLTWTQQVIATGGSHNIRLADIDSDGDTDIVGANWHGNTPFEMWRNELNPAFSLDEWERHVVDGARPERAIFVRAADLNGDGLKDITAGAWWYPNPGSPGGNWTRNTIGAPLNNIAIVHDFDNDGDTDIFGTQGVGSASNPAFAWARNDGGGSFTTLTNISGGSGDFLQGAVTSVFQAGGSRELGLSWHASNAGIQRLIVPSNPSTTQWAVSQLSATSQDEELSVGDIDRDGDNDILLGTKWLRNDGGSWTTFTLSSTSGLPDRNRLVDVNGDGRLDAVVGFEFIRKLAWYEQGASATGTWTEHIISDTFFAPMSLDAADLDFDGDIDVVAGEHNLSNPSAAQLHVFENLDDQGLSWGVHSVHTGDEHHDGVQLVDIDNDSDLDIISIGWSHDDVVLYENKANGGGGPPPNLPPVAQFTATPSSGTSPLFVSFDASGSSDPNGDPLTYSWDFGDQATGSGKTISHTYLDDGAYQATLTVSDAGLQAVAAKTIAVGELPIDAGLVTYWALDEASGVSANDQIGGFDGVLVNGPTWQPSQGQLSGALQFDGVDDRVDIGVLDIPAGSNMTIAFWAKLNNGNGSDARFISKAIGETEADHYWMVSLLNDTAVRFRLKAGGTTTTLISGPGEITPGAWNHLAVTYDGSRMQIYKNGVLIASTAKSGNVNNGSSIRVALGDQPPGAGDKPYSGLLDDVRLYDRSLSTSEVATLAATTAVPVLFQTIDARVIGDVVQVSWEAYSTSGLTGFEVFRDGTKLNTVTLSPDQGVFEDNSIEPGATYTYYVSATDDLGDVARSPDVTLTIPRAMTRLDQNMPNPFNPVTAIPFFLSVDGDVELTIYDARGARVTQLLGRSLTAGPHSITWNATDGAGRAVATGVYFYRLRTAQGVFTRKLAVLK